MMSIFAYFFKELTNVLLEIFIWEYTILRSLRLCMSSFSSLKCMAMAIECPAQQSLPPMATFVYYEDKVYCAERKTAISFSS